MAPQSEKWLAIETCQPQLIEREYSMNQTQTAIRTTVVIEWTNAPLIRMSANVDMPEYGIKADQTFYLSRSSKNDGTYYIATWDYNETCWMCRCPARKPCKHMRLINADCHKLAATRKAAKLERAARLAAQKQAQEAEQEADVSEVLAEIDARPPCEDCPGRAHPMCCTNTLQRPQDEPTAACPIVSVPTIAPKVTQPAITIVPLKTTPTVRNVSQDWLLGHRTSTFSGRAS